jgi:hypothetical protein
MQYTVISSLLYAIHCYIIVVVCNTLVYNRCCMQYTGIQSLLYTIHWYIAVVVCNTLVYNRCCRQYTLLSYPLHLASWHSINWLGFFWYPKQSATVSVGSVLKWRTRSWTHTVNWAENMVDEHPIWYFLALF